ncbi:MAG TPA: hypothetical protein VGV16_09020 [Gammaproteobacteria bacterium]|nr:hypothetical protein [Gammaproteobacteria bacterium]
MKSLHLNFLALEIGSLWLLRGLVKASAVGLGMAIAATLLVLFWFGSALSEALDAISEHVRS